MTTKRNIIDPTAAPAATTAELELELESGEVLVSVREMYEVF